MWSVTHVAHLWAIMFCWVLPLRGNLDFCSFRKTRRKSSGEAEKNMNQTWLVCYNLIIIRFLLVLSIEIASYIGLMVCLLGFCKLLWCWKLYLCVGIRGLVFGILSYPFLSSLLELLVVLSPWRFHLKCTMMRPWWSWDFHVLKVSPCSSSLCVSRQARHT